MVRRTIAAFMACLCCLPCAWVLGPAPAYAGIEGCNEHLPPPGGGRGAEPHEPHEPHALGAAEARRMAAGTAGRSGALRAPDTDINVPLWVHVLTDGRTGATTESVRRQVEALNSAYGGRFGGADTRIRFRVAGTTRTVNGAWFQNPLGNEMAMKSRLRRGGAETLNLYVGQLKDLVLGYSTYPNWYRRTPRLDGVVIDWRVLPDGSLGNFNRGFTAVHEIGHWLGLLHPFEHGCSGGDGVEDTPQSSGPTEGCPTTKDTCPATGSDPIHNFMDYSHDRCMREFTTGQAVRIHELWGVYRTVRDSRRDT